MKVKMPFGFVSQEAKMRAAGAIIAVVVIVLIGVLLLGGMGMMGFWGYGTALAPHASAGVRGYGGYGMMWPWAFGSGAFGPGVFGPSFPLGGILVLVFWALVIIGIVLLVVWAVRSAGRGATLTSTSGPSPLDILKARYARGEITKEQFDQIKADLA